MYCVWLTFKSPDISEIILKLAREYDGPVFQPHCTILGKTDKSLPRLKSAVIDLISNYESIDVHPVKISFTDNLWRALYIELDEKTILNKWHEDTCESLDIECDNDYLPHISLMYNTISAREKGKLLGKIKLKSVYKIKSIQIIECSDKVNDWRTVFELKI
jgi:2'-5' RNA ligase